MASGSVPFSGEEPARSEASSSSPLSCSPEPGRLQLQELLDMECARASPKLSRKALDELGPDNESCPDDSDNPPLHSPWTFWYDRSPRGSSAEDFFANLRKIYTVRTIKAFWRVVNNLRSVDQLGERESYHLMRNEGRRPVWEDEANKDGGLWSFRVRKEDTAMVWQELLLAAIGEQFSECMAEDDDVCGVSVRIRGYEQNVIQIWNDNADLHSSSNVIQKVKQLVPSIEINEFYQSSRSKVQDSYHKPQHHYSRGFSPPPGGGGGGRRYPGGPPPMQPQMFVPPGPHMYQPGPPHIRHRHPGHFAPRYGHPPPPSSRSPYHSSRPPYTGP